MSTKFDLRRRIRQLENLDPSKASFETLKRSFRFLDSGTITAIGRTRTNEMFFRARKNPPYKLVSVDDLGPPPAKRVTGFQRCNGPGEPMFYVSSRRRTALAEIRVAKGDKVYLSQWRSSDGIPYNRFFDPALDDHLRALISEKSGDVLDFYKRLFTQHIEADASDHYKFTAAITSYMTQGFVADNYGVDKDGLVALRYPSVLDLTGSYNTVMHPSLAAKRLYPLHVMELTIEDASDPHLRCAVTDNAYRFENNTLLWSGSPSAYPVLQNANGEQWLMWCEQDGWTCGVNPNGYNSDYVASLLIE